MEDDFQHFLSYSSLSGEPADVLGKLRKAYAANWTAQPIADVSAPTGISAQLREYAGNPGYSHNDYADVMRQAADECERFYGDMMNWKANAQAKDRIIAEQYTHNSKIVAPAADVIAPTDERAAFEAWMRKECGADDVSLQRCADGHYLWGRTCDMWAACEFARAAAPVSAMTDKLLLIIAYAYQIAGAHDAPDHILDVLANPEEASDEQIEAMLPYVVAPVSGPSDASIPTQELAHKAAFQRGIHRAADIYWAANGGLLRQIIEGEVGRQTLHKLSIGQGTETDDGRVWLAAKAVVDDLAAPVSGQGAITDAEIVSIMDAAQAEWGTGNVDGGLRLHVIKSVLKHIDSRPRSEDSRAEVLEEAARYRWLRDGAAEGHPSSEGSNNKDAYLVITGYDDQYPMSLDQKDAAVDVALASITQPKADNE
jgi:hypothetical protein